MKKHIFKRVLGFALSGALLLSGFGVSAEPVNLNLKWPAPWEEGTPPDWAQNLDQATKDATLAAFNTEYNRQLESGYNLGTPSEKGITAYGSVVGLQYNGGDNVGNPWDQPDRRWAISIAPYPGMVFSVTGQIAKQFTSIQAPLANAITWTNPSDGSTRMYQVYTNGEVLMDTTGANKNGWGFCPGSGVTGTVTEAFKHAYAESAWMNASFGEPYNLGCIHSNAATEGNIVYQEFWGNDSTGASPQAGRGLDKAYGISYLAADGLNADKAYVITDKIFTAWTSTWGNATGSNPTRFAVTGAPIGNQYTDEDGNIRQDFQYKSIIIDADGNVSILSSTAEMSDFALENGTLFLDGTDLTVLVPAGTDVTGLAPTFTISADASVDKSSGSAQDFTNPVTYTVSAPNGNQTVYTVTVVVASTPSAADAAKAKVVSDQISAIVNISMNDVGAIAAARTAYRALTPKQKVLVTNFSDLDSYEAMIAELAAHPFRIACVGDSITEGSAASSPSKSYPAQLQTVLGSAFEVKNFGVSGRTLLKKGDYPYWNEGQFTASKNYQPNVVIIMLGTNDSKSQNWGPYKNEFKTDYLDLIAQYRALDSKPVVYVATAPTVTRDNFGITQTVTTGEVVPLQKEIAEEAGCPIIDINAFTAGQTDWFADGVHPNDFGYGKLAEHFATYLTPYNDATLSGLKVGGVDIAGFSPEKRNYTVQTLEGAALPEITAVAANENATVEITQATGGLPAAATVLVTAPNSAYRYTYTITFSATVVTPGDVNGDGKVNATDIIMIRKLMMTGETTGDQLAAGDLSGDDKLTAVDVMLLRKMLLQM